MAVRTVVVAALVVAAAALLFARPWEGSTPGGEANPGPGMPPSPGLEARPTPKARVAYWLDRLLMGPEPTVYHVKDLHSIVLADAVENLVSTPKETLERLADAAIVERVVGSRDANPWHAVLRVLEKIGRGDPAVARRYAAPALESEWGILSRAALPVYAAIASAGDGPDLARALGRLASNKAFAPFATEILVALGPPWDGEAARAVFAGAVADSPDMSSTPWERVALGSESPDVLAWWALLSESRGPVVVPARAAAGTAESPPLDQVLSTGRRSAAFARAALAARGFPAYEASVRADAAGADPDLASIARGGTPTPQRDRGRERRLVSEVADALATGRPPALDGAALEHLAASLSDDDDPDSARSLARIVADLPLSPANRPALLAAYGALAKRGVPPRAIVTDHLRSSEPREVDRAFLLIRFAQDRAYLPFVSALAHGPPSPRRAEARRTALLLVSAALRDGGLDPEEVARWARTVSEWAADPADPSGPGLLSVLLDLGKAGESRLAEGLSGPRRDDHRAAISRRVGRSLSPEIAAALLGPVGGSTPAEDRRAVLDKAFAVAGPDWVPSLRALSRRLPPHDRAEVEVVIRAAAHRTP